MESLGAKRNVSQVGNEPLAVQNLPKPGIAGDT
jgi:hypothetical protein